MILVKSVSYRYKVNNSLTGHLPAKRELRQGDPLSLMLFVLIMEYLHRLLQKIGRNTNFNFHSKCEKIKIIDFCFADDLLLFTRGDSVSVYLALSALRDFTDSTGLEVNPSKCKVCCGGRLASF
ncbi:unnamed protein product [Vicia faba]|uniref:Reverse transcriptase domain-containing protein n=1 Tax=Vicia faba TaxID=3906 RepID=A0AAV1AAY8_VICFA|nr:unnamed protein product [Vicia faba]